ncbi:MAG: hypothetical protein DBY17_09265 [Oscillospiraceae bacterium]|nr:MAG: hypothetical protein DBY17_09265 [Oscillospiraceae bacterium]
MCLWPRASAPRGALGRPAPGGPACAGGSGIFCAHREKTLDKCTTLGIYWLSKQSSIGRQPCSPCAPQGPG